MNSQKETCLKYTNNSINTVVNSSPNGLFFFTGNLETNQSLKFSKNLSKLTTINYQINKKAQQLSKTPEILVDVNK